MCNTDLQMVERKKYKNQFFNSCISDSLKYKKTFTRASTQSNKEVERGKRDFDTQVPTTTSNTTPLSQMKSYKPKKAHDPQAQFLKKQVKEEKAMSSKLRLNSKIEEQLLERHSMPAIAKFFEQHAKTIEKQHYLYQVPNFLPSAHSATFQPIWCATEKKIYPLDSFSYCLFTRSEKKSALTANVDKGIFFHSLSLSLSLSLCNPFILFEPKRNRPLYQYQASSSLSQD